MGFTRKTYHSLGEKRYILSLLIVALIFGGLFLALRSSKVQLEENILKISGPYGMNVNIDDIKEVSLKDTLPENFRKTKGIDFFDLKYIGNFNSDDLGKVKTYVYSNKKPYLYITLNSGEYNHIIVAYKDKKQTEALYKNIVDKKNKNK